MSQLLSKGEIAQMTGMTANDIPDDIVTLAETRVEEKLGKKYTTGTKTETFLLYTSQSFIKLKHRYIIAVSLFTIEDVNETGLSEDDNEFFVFKDEGIIQCSSLVTYKEISITYTYGSCTVGDLDKYLHLLYVLKMLISSNPDLVPKEEISEKIGDYSVHYNVAELKGRPSMLDDEIVNVIAGMDDNDLHFI